MKTPPLFTKLSHKLAASRFLSVSLAIHFVLIALLSTIVIIETRREKPSFEGTVAPPEEDIVNTTDDPPIDTVDSTPSAPATPVSMIGVVGDGGILPISSELFSGNTFIGTPGSFVSDPVFDRESSKVSVANIGRPGLGIIAGTPIDARKLGVVLDISGSAHGYLHRPLREIESGFQNAVVVLYSGCGMKADARKRDFDFKRGNAIKLGHFKDAKAKPRDIGEVLDQAAMKNSELGSDLSRVLSRPHLFGVEWGDNNNRAIFGVHFALQRLIRDDVDAIYWFADFQDELDSELLEELTADLKRRHIKVYCHNFAGKFPTPAREAAVRRLAEETGGKCILAVPGK